MIDFNNNQKAYHSIFRDILKNREFTIESLRSQYEEYYREYYDNYENKLLNEFIEYLLNNKILSECDNKYEVYINTIFDIPYELRNLLLKEDGISIIKDINKFNNYKVSFDYDELENYSYLLMAVLPNNTISKIHLLNLGLFIDDMVLFDMIEDMIVKKVLKYIGNDKFSVISKYSSLNKSLIEMIDNNSDFEISDLKNIFIEKNMYGMFKHIPLISSKRIVCYQTNNKFSTNKFSFNRRDIVVIDTGSGYIIGRIYYNKTEEAILVDDGKDKSFYIRNIPIKDGILSFKDYNIIKSILIK